MPYPTSMPKSILCVCLGNICRSPTAEAVFRQKLASPNASHSDHNYIDNDLATLALLSHEDPNDCQKALPDPYYGDADDFEAVLDQVESSVDAWIYSWNGI